MFTNRFIQIPVRVFAVDVDNLSVDRDNASHTVSQMKLNPFHITSYHNTMEDGEPVLQLSMQNGDTYIVYLTVKAFEKILNKF